MKIFSFSKLFAVALLSLAAFTSSCNKDQDNEPKPQTFDHYLDQAVGQYAYTIEWRNITNGVDESIEGMETITGTVELRKNAAGNGIELYEDGEQFIDFSPCYESPEGFSFNNSWVETEMDGETLFLWPHDIFPMEGDVEAGVFYKDSRELNFAWTAEVEDLDLAMIFRGERKN
ncbi:MAG: hypothetical protein AAFZ63_19785 [Bacteroidota bacterium]